MGMIAQAVMSNKANGKITYQLEIRGFISQVVTVPTNQMERRELFLANERRLFSWKGINLSNPHEPFNNCHRISSQMEFRYSVGSSWVRRALAFLAACFPSSACSSFWACTSSSAALRRASASFSRTWRSRSASRIVSTSLSRTWAGRGDFDRHRRWIHTNPSQRAMFGMALLDPFSVRPGPRARESSIGTGLLLAPALQ
jgi:hypothetical protein